MLSLIQRDRPWRLVHYVLPSGRVPVKEWLEELEETNKVAALVFYDVLVPALKRFGPEIAAPHFERISGKTLSNILGVGEIRWSGRDRAHYRIYCSIEADQKLVLYLGTIKRWPAFTSEHKKTCVARYKDYHHSSYNAQTRQDDRTRAQRG